MLNVEIGVECQIFVIVIFFNCSWVLQFGAHSRYYKGALTQKRSFLVICTTFRSALHVGWKNQNKHSTLTRFIIRRSVQMTWTRHYWEISTYEKTALKREILHTLCCVVTKCMFFLKVLSFIQSFLIISKLPVKLTFSAKATQIWI